MNHIDFYTTISPHNNLSLHKFDKNRHEHIKFEKLVLSKRFTLSDI